MKNETKLKIKADGLYDALNKLLTGLAKDGTAIEGFTDGWKAIQEYQQENLNTELARLLPSTPEPDKEESQEDLWWSMLETMDECARAKKGSIPTLKERFTIKRK